MNITKAPVLAVVTALSVLAAASPAASAASAVSLRYQCSSSKQVIDDAGYTGPAPDNWTIKIKVCAARSRATVHAYAEAQWDGPYYASADAVILDAAKLRLQIKQARQGTDAVVTERDFADIKSPLEKATPSGDRDGRYRTPTISSRAASGAVADVILYLDWHRDGRGYRRYDYTGSPTV
ncbi:hypothetical protein ACE1OC_43205 (plasmid) [Streptomyces sp. DSM 116496]|uniref:hypothetical protein n=1 Tax=Streptomyces stoeckheimensis TaxID=3344656 RepID=UPI0038B27C13